MQEQFTLTGSNDAAGGLTLLHLRGTVIRSVFENPDTGYAVLKVELPGGDESVFTGALAHLRAGEEISAAGRWETHKTHGRQFKVESFQMALPSNAKGIIKYLSSGVLKGIGQKTAKDIVAHFGPETLSILSNAPRRLLEVPGLGRKRVEQVISAWAAQAQRRETYIFLHGLGIGSLTCQKLFRRYGGETAAIVRANPYRLADDVHGIGFLSADRVAHELGIAADAPIRICAGILYALKQLTLSGHTCYPLHLFYPYCAKLLDAESALIRENIDYLRKHNRVVIEETDPVAGPLIFDAALHRLECELVQDCSAVLHAARYAGERLRNIPPISAIAFSDEQLRAVDSVARSPLTIITGGPGVGKTTVIGELVGRARKAGLKIQLAAPTGRAAQRMSESTHLKCSTIHRLLKWIPATNTFEYNREKPLPCNLLVIDEVSMLDLQLAALLFRAVKPGTSVVLVGDKDQLASVGAGKVLHDLMASNCCPVSHLSHIYRQGNTSQIVVNAHLINEGKMPVKPDFAEGDGTHDFYWIEQDDPVQAVSQICEMMTRRIPNRFGFDPMRDIQILTPMNRGDCGVMNLNAMLQEALNGGEVPQVKIGDRILKVGDRVIQTLNNYELNVFNGDLGHITEIYRHLSDGHVTVDFDGRRVEYPLSDVHQLTLAYAITVHKSQGSEFPCVIFPMLSQHYIMLQRNLLYTGVTRAKKLLILIGSSKSIGMAVRNFKQEPRYTTLESRLRETLRDA